MLPTIILFFALLMSYFIIMNAITAIAYEKTENNSEFLVRMIFLCTTIALWSYFYYLTH